MLPFVDAILRVFVSFDWEVPTEMTEGQIRLDRPSLIGFEALLIRFGYSFFSFRRDPVFKVGLMDGAHRLIAYLIAANAWKCRAASEVVIKAVNRLR